MTDAIESKIRERVAAIETTPAIPAVFLPLLEMLNLPAEQVKLEEVVRLVSYDNTIAAQCLRMASSPLFGLAKAPTTIKAAVISLGLRRVQTILMACCMGNAFPARNWALDRTVFWRHVLGCAMVCQRFSKKLGAEDADKAYMAGLLHDIGLLVNCMVYPKEFAVAVAHATEHQIPLDEAETATMGFTHCMTGKALAERWNMADDIVQVVAHHHHPGNSQTSRPLVALVHLSDLLCRMRSLGYGYYERQKLDMVHDPAWAILATEYRNLEGVDLVRFTFELDEATEEIFTLVSNIFGQAAGAH